MATGAKAGRLEIDASTGADTASNGVEETMQKYALYGRLKVKPGMEGELEAFLKQGGVMAQAEPATIRWFAIKEDDGAYSIFDTFDDEAGREAHLNGEIAKALMANADRLLSEPPQIHKIEVLAEK
jgi:quinol monooxygenase YgiN